MFVVIILFSVMMYAISKILVSKLWEIYPKENNFLEIILLSNFSALLIVHNELNFLTMLYIILFIFVMYQTIIINRFIHAFFKFLKIENKKL